MMMTMSKTTIATIILFAISAVLAVFLYVENIPPPAHKYDAFARCIAQSSTTFYGAFWCPHCAAQKKLFGTGAQYLPYHECSTPDGNGELQSCIDAGVKGYPTWVFANGSRLTGVAPLSQLAAKTGCALPTSTPATS
jgi:glutaredoxin